MTDEEIVFYFMGLPEWFNYSGDASLQAAHQLPNGKLLRVGITDSDVAEKQGIWVDVYEGLQLA